ADELSQDELVFGRPHLTDLVETVHGLGSKEKERAFGQLVTKEAVREIERVARARPTELHENRRKERRPDPNAVNEDEQREPMLDDKERDVINGLDELARSRTD